MGQLDGKVAIVTGATSGIGERIAESFVAEGARVVAAGRREPEGRALEARCGPGLSIVRTDVADEASVKAMVTHAVTRFGRLDCLVNNAGGGSPMVSITEVAGEHFSAVFDECSRRHVRHEACGARHDRAALRQHHYDRQRRRSSRWHLWAFLQRVESCSDSALA